MDDSLLYGIVTLGAGVLLAFIRYTFRSKCTEVSLCYGLVEIKRDIEGEIENTELEQHNIGRQQSDSTNP